MKKLLWTSAMALTAAACMTACDDSSSGASNSIPEFKTEAALPDTCEMEVAKAGDTYFACFENKWIEVTDSATVEQLKEGLDEDEIKEKLEELEDLLKPATPAKPKSSSSKKTDEDVESNDSEEPESSASEEECTGRRCKTGSSSSKKPSGGNGSGDSGSGSGEGGGDDDTESASSGTSTESASSGTSTESASSGTSTESASSGTSTESASSGTSTETCGTATYNPETHFCRPRDNAVIAIADAGCCDDGRTCRYYSYTDYPNTYYDRNKEFCDNRTGADYRIYKMVTIGEQVWMAENLNYPTSSGSSCYGDDPDNCDTYGRLYTWDAAREACPSGWHVPSNSEFSTLTSAFEKPTSLHMKADSDLWTNGKGDDTHGFSALPGGIYSPRDEKYNYLNKLAFFWSSNLSGSDAYYFIVYYNTDDAYFTTNPTTYRVSVRCIKDAE